MIPPILMYALRRHKHLLLLIVAISGLALQPLTRLVTFGVIIYELLAYCLLMAVFLVVFNGGRERAIGLALGVPGVVANLVGHVSTGDTKLFADVTYHAFGVLFLGYAVGVILQDVFRSRRIGRDQMLGAFSGYVLAGVAWGNLYVTVQILFPGSFQIASGLAWQLEADDTRRFLFNYFSFATLTTVGYGDVTPLAPAACTLAWLEAMFGQFYMAVFIGQLIGLKLAQSTSSAAD